MESKDNLLKLPQELRDHIYTILFTNDQTSTSRSAPRPAEPPLTLTSKQIRSETLPIFYSLYTPTTQSYIKCDFYGHTRITTNHWYCKLHPDKLRHIRNLKVRFGLIQRYTGELVPLEFQIALFKRDGMTRYCLSHSFDRAWIKNHNRMGDPADFEDVVAVLRGHLYTVLEGIAEADGLTVEDLDRLVKVDPESLPLRTIS